MTKPQRRAKAQCPKCGFNIEGFVQGRLGNKGFRLAAKGESGTYKCPKCNSDIVPLE